MILGLETWVVAIVATTLVVGATVQGLVGLGIGLVSAPVVTLLEPELMPQLLLWLALLLPAATLVRDHERIDWRGLAWAVPARVPGTAVGVLCVGWFSTLELGIAVGTMVLLSVLLTARAVRLPVNRGMLTGAGFLSGVTGTATSIGGPPMAILYQHRNPSQIRSTLAVYFICGAAFSLLGLAVAGALDLRTFALALMMLPCLVVGLIASRLLRQVVPTRHTRRGVLVVCALSALTLLVKSLAG